MAFQEVFKILLDNKDFKVKIDDLIQSWTQFSKFVEGKQINFNINKATLGTYKKSLLDNAAVIEDTVNKIQKKFSNVKFKPEELLTNLEQIRKKTDFKVEINSKSFLDSVTQNLDKAQAKLNQNPITVLEKVQLDLKSLEKEKDKLTNVQVGVRKGKITRQLGEAEGQIGTKFIKDFSESGFNNFAGQLELVKTKIKSLGGTTSKTGKEFRELKKFVEALKTTFSIVDEATRKGQGAQARFLVFEKLKGFQPEFLNSFETAINLAQKLASGEKVNAKTIAAAATRLQNAITVEEQLFTTTTEGSDARSKILQKEQQNALAATEQGGKARLESHKRISLKITDSSGKIFRPVGEAIEDISKQAEEALVRSKEFSDAASNLKVSANNPLSKDNLKKNADTQQLFNDKVQEFLNIQEKIRGLESAGEKVTLKRVSGAALSEDEAGAALDAEAELVQLKLDSTKITNELNGLQKQSLANEKVITKELAKQLRLNEENKKTLVDITTKQSARVDKLATFQPQQADLPDLPSAEKAQQNFKKLQEIHEKATAAEVEAGRVSKDLLAAQGDAARTKDVSSLKKTVGEKLAEVRKFNGQFVTATEQLTRQIHKANANAATEFTNIESKASTAATKAAEAAEKARTHAAAQGAKVRGLIERGATKEVIAEHQLLSTQLSAIAARREQDDQASQLRLAKIQKEGTLKKLQAAKLDVKPAVVKTVDNLSALVNDTEKQLPKLTQLIAKRQDIESRGNALSLQATQAKNAEEKRLITEAQNAQIKAAKNSQRDINDAQKGVSGQALKDREVETERSIKDFTKKEEAALRATKTRLAEEARLARANERQIVAAEKKLDLENKGLSADRAARLKFEDQNRLALAGKRNRQLVAAAKEYHQALIDLEEARKQRIASIEDAIARIRSRGTTPSSSTGGRIAGGRRPGPPSGPPSVPPSGPLSIAPFLAQVRQGQNEFNKLNKSAGFFNDVLKGFEKNLGQSIGSVIKFQLAWRITGGIIATIGAPVALIGDALKKGFGFLVELQDKATDLREVLLLNVKFSDNIAANFEEAGKAAKFVVLQQQELSGQIGVGQDKFQSVFESFAASGGLKAVKTLGDDTETTFNKANRSVALLITALNSVGISSRDTRRATENTNKLLEGRVKTADKIRVASGLTADELNRQSLEAQKVGKFAEFVEGIFGAQAKRIDTSNQRFSTLLTQLQIFEARLGALFVKPVFDKTIEIFQKLVVLLKESEALVSKFAQTSAILFGRIASALIDVGEALTTGFLLPLKVSLAVLDELSQFVQKIVQKILGVGDVQGVGIFKAMAIGIAAVADVFGVAAQFVTDYLTSILALAKTVIREVAPEKGPNEKALKRLNIAGVDPDTQDRLNSALVSEAREKDRVERIKQDKDDLIEFQKLLKQKELMEQVYRDARFADDYILNKKKSALEAATTDAQTERLAKDVAQTRSAIKNEETIRINSLRLVDEKIRKLRLNPTVALASTDILGNLDANINAALEKTSKLLDDGEETLTEKLSGFKPNLRGGGGEDGKKGTFDNDRLNALNERLREQFELITQQTEIFIARQKTLQEDRVQSEVETTQRISAKLEEQIAKLRSVTRDAIKESVTFKEADPRAIEKFANENNRRLLDIDGKAKVQRESLRRENAKRLQALDEGAFKAAIARDRQQADLEAQINQENFNQGAITQEEFISEQIEQEKDLSEIIIAEQRRRFDAVSKNSEDSQAVSNEILQSRIASQNKVLDLEKQLEEVRRQLIARRNALAIQDLELARTQSQTVIDLQEQGTVSEQQRLDNQVKLTAATRALVDAQLAEAQRLLDQQRALKLTTEIIKEQEQAVESLRQAQLRAVVEEAVARRRATRGTGKKVLEDITGQDFTSDRQAATQEQIKIRLDKLDLEVDPREIRKLEDEIRTLSIAFQGLNESGLEKFGKSVLGVVNQLQGAISAVIQGFQQGGIGGAVGAGLSQVGSIFQKALGSAGPIVQAAGAVVTLIASAFQAAARRLAQKIKKDFDKTLQTFRDEGASLGRTITSLEAQRIAAIERLSGKKGGKKQLEELLPEFDSAIKDLVKSQKEIQESFEDELGSLRLGNDALRDFSNAWDEVNKKVQAYVDSFRDGELTLEKQANAVEFLSLSLQKLQGELLDDLADAEKEAISNALELNDLFKERADLIKQMVRDQEEFNKAQFELLTADALETRVAGVVERGNALVKLRQDFADKQQESKDRLILLNAEIALKQRIFDKEKGIFNLTLDRTKLQQRNNVLEEASLDRQIERWRDIKGIIDGIQRDPVTGNFSLSPALQGQISPRITTVNVGAPQIHIEVNTGGAPINSREITDPLTTFFADQSRFGFHNS